MTPEHVSGQSEEAQGQLAVALPNRGMCRTCGTFSGLEALACSGCGALLYAAQLEQLAARAAACDDPARERALWAEALPMLPVETVQYRSVSAKLAELDGKLAMQTEKKQGWRGKGTAGLGPLGLLLWKLKTVLLVVLTKGKLLLLGLTKISTLLSMFASLGLYWALYGWKFAAGIVISIYIHEMGHVQALRRFGIAATAPMFIPGFGALIRVRGGYLDPVEDARTGLAGPLYGLGAAAVAFAIYLGTGVRIWGAIAQFGAVINVFNLIPVWQLDGARGFHSLAQWQRGVVMGIALALWFVTSEPMFLLVGAGCGYRLFTKDAATVADKICLQQFAGLLVAFSVIAALTKGLGR